MKLSYGKTIAFALIGLLAGPLSLAGANSMLQEKVLQNVYNDKGQIIGQTRGNIPAPASDPGYKVFSHSHKTDAVEVYYPQIDLPKNMVTAILANYQLIQTPGNYMANIAPSATLTMDYTVTRQDENIISVAFRGEQVEKNSKEPILASVNYNLKTRVPLTAIRLIRNTDEAKQGVSRLLAQAATTRPAAVKPPVYADTLNFYLTGKYVVFFYQPDPAAKYVELPVSIDLIRPYLTAEYSSLAVTNEVSKDPHQVIAEIDNALTNYQSVKGKRNSGDVSADYTAYFAADQLVYIEESQTKGEYDRATAKYYFDGGKLVAYTKDAKNLIVPIGKVATIQHEEISMFYDTALHLANGELKIDGITSALPDAQIQSVYTAAEEIRSSAAALLIASTKQQ